MARQAKARLDTKGLTALGLDKLVEILLEEAVANKALKARLMTALAGHSGPDEIARLIDKRLDAIEKARTSINSTRARDLAVELSGLMRNIQSELGAIDTAGAFERMIRFISMRTGIDQRLRAESAKLKKVFEEASAALATLLPQVPEADQVRAVPMLERLRKRDRYDEQGAFFAGLLCSLVKPAADAWRIALEADLSATDRAQAASRLLQALHLKTGDLDAYVRLETAKPENRQDAYKVARMLFEAGRHDEALAWVRKTPPAMRILFFDGIAAGVGPDYQSRERRLLEADILDGMKQRDSAQALRWRDFLETFDPEVLRRYIARLDDFAEFDELDKAFAAVRASDHIYEGLMFLVEWPKLDQAAAHVMAHAKKWDGRMYEILVPSADALSDDHPVASTVLYRALVTHILDRGISAAYEHAAVYLRILATLSLRLPEKPPFIDHAAYVSGLANKHGRKYGFWQRVPDAIQ